MGEESGRLVGSEPFDPEVEAYVPENLTSGLIAPNTFPGSVDTTAPYSEGDPELYTNEFASGMPAEGFEDDGSTHEDNELGQTRAQIEQTRAEMSTTIDAIQEKLSPQNIAQQAKDTVKEATVGKAQEMVSNAGDTASELVSNAGNSAKGFSSNLVETVKSNPVPAALAGIGLGWLFMSGRKQSTGNSSSSNYSDQYNSAPRGYNPGRSGRYGYESYGQTSGSPLGDRLAGAQDKVGGFAGQAQDKASNVAGQVQDTAGQVAGQVQDTAGQLADSAQYGAQRAQGAFQQALQANPLAVGVAAVAVGAAIGLSIPETQKENQLLGETRDDVMQQAQQTVQEKAQQVQAVAQQAVGAAKDAAQQSADQQGLTQK
jgi:ElaB/YqjD/DUF883 family membrane-anchored ribosome-binding protein